MESDWIGLYQGVPQATILGPLPFNRYIKDLNKQIPANTKIIQYADDTIILTYNTDLNLATYNREQSLGNISQYYEEHRLMLNHSKTEFITFSKKNPTRRNQKKQSVNWQLQNTKRQLRKVPRYISWLHIKFSRKIKTCITQNGYRDKKY